MKTATLWAGGSGGGETKLVGSAVVGPVVEYGLINQRMVEKHGSDD